MSIENYGQEYPSLREALSPKQKLDVALANIIDQQGERRDSEPGKRVDEAHWNDDKKYRFVLKRTVTEIPWDYVEYSFNIFKGTSLTTWIASYEYDAGCKKLSKSKKEGGPISKNGEKDIPQLLEYLRSGTSLSDEDNQMFLEIMDHNQVQDPRGVRKVSILASVALARWRHSVHDI